MFDQQWVRQRSGGEHPHDFLRRVPISIRICHARERRTKMIAYAFANFGNDGVRLRLRIEHIACPLPSPLPETDIHHR
jgi:hypothetical protein